jgi:hypothetical protein
MASATSFWARRKAAVQAEEQAEAAAAQAALDAAQAEAIAAEQAGKSDDALLADLGLPDPDTLSQGDDFAAFMGRAVPDHLRRRALRKLWGSDPVLANLDGLVDHGEDYTDAATVIPGMQTAYQVGKGMMQHVIALAEQASEVELGETEAQDAPAAQDVPVLAETTPEPAPEADGATEPAVTQTEVTSRPRRHMRFEFTS